MPLILSLETSTDVCSAALRDDGRLLAASEIHEPQIHAARLAPMVNALCHEAGVTLKQIEAVAVSSGPGSYTGLRIGASTAKGICYALDIPLIAVGTLELLAFQGNATFDDGDLLCPMIDARRMEVYCMVTDRKLKVVEAVSAKVIDENAFQELLKTSRVVFFGNGAGKCAAVIRDRNAVFREGIVPLASSLGLMAQAKFEAGEFENLVDFKPFYLKEFVAKVRQR